MTGRPAPQRRRAPGLAGRLLLAQVLVIAVGALTLAVTAGLVAPGLFRSHLARSGVTADPVRHHAEEAFASSFLIAVTVAAAAALLAAGAVSWFLVRRLSRPVEQLADAADTVADGRYDVTVPAAPFSGELQRLSDAFAHMAHRLADTDAARTRLLSDLSHELRTPLATLTAFIDGLEDGVVPADTAAYATMRDQVTRLQRLARDVRDIARAEEEALELRLSTTDPAELAGAAVAAVAPRFAAAGVSLELRTPAAVPAVAGDPDRLGQVLGNLLDNALRHTARGGHVTVELSSRTDPRAVVLSVRDDGAGIPVDQLETIFERFHRADASRHGVDGGGSGLGLTIARAIVHAHQGTITATSDGPGTGAVVTITVPAQS